MRKRERGTERDKEREREPKASLTQPRRAPRNRGARLCACLAGRAGRDSALGRSSRLLPPRSPGVRSAGRRPVPGRVTRPARGPALGAGGRVLGGPSRAVCSRGETPRELSRSEAGTLARPARGTFLFRPPAQSREAPTAALRSTSAASCWLHAGASVPAEPSPSGRRERGTEAGSEPGAAPFPPRYGPATRASGAVPGVGRRAGADRPPQDRVPARRAPPPSRPFSASRRDGSGRRGGAGPSCAEGEHSALQGCCPQPTCFLFPSLPPALLSFFFSMERRTFLLRYGRHLYFNSFSFETESH